MGKEWAEEGIKKEGDEEGKGEEGRQKKERMEELEEGMDGKG